MLGMETIDITRGTKSFTVVDDPQTKSWDFWGTHYATKHWEPGTLDIIGDVISNQISAGFVDIGAWVGPTTLWAAAHGARVFAVEPDPVAREALERNVRLNGFELDVTVSCFAVSDTDDDRVTLKSFDGLGSSMSSLVRPSGESAKLCGVTVTTKRLDNYLDNILTYYCDACDSVENYAIDLIKIDIEGAEGKMLTDNGNLYSLRNQEAPVLIDVHYPWAGDPSKLDAALSTLGKKTVIDNTNPDFPTYLFTP